MSSAHRPTWDPAQGKDARGTSKIVSARDLTSQSRLKFRQPGQGTTSELQRRDLKLELLAAESDSSARKAKGLSGFARDAPVAMIMAGESAFEEPKRVQVLASVAGLDADDSDEENDTEQAVKGNGKGKGRAVSEEAEQEQAQAQSEEEESSDDDDDEDETAELLRELEKIKRERAEEKEKLERERSASDQTTREEEIATGNPLLNLQAALGIPGSPSPSVSSSSAASSSFGVKRRWDDDVIFKNQARGVSETPKREFVNDLLRTEFHKRFMKKFIA